MLNPDKRTREIIENTLGGMQRNARGKETARDIVRRNLAVQPKLSLFGENKAIKDAKGNPILPMTGQKTWELKELGPTAAQSKAKVRKEFAAKYVDIVTKKAGEGAGKIMEKMFAEGDLRKALLFAKGIIATNDQTYAEALVRANTDKVTIDEQTGQFKMDVSVNEEIARATWLARKGFKTEDQYRASIHPQNLLVDSITGPKRENVRIKRDSYGNPTYEKDEYGKDKLVTEPLKPGERMNINDISYFAGETMKARTRQEAIGSATGKGFDSLSIREKADIGGTDLMRGATDYEINANAFGGDVASAIKAQRQQEREQLEYRNRGGKTLPTEKRVVVQRESAKPTYKTKEEELQDDINNVQSQQ